ncbi:DNA-directed RNA polymerase, partial [Pseudoloma neurophilia]
QKNKIKNIIKNCMIKPNVLITKQIEGDILDLTMFATRSNAIDHSKHSVVTICFYKPIRKIRLTKIFKGKQAKILQRTLTDKVIEIKNDQAILINEMVELGKIMNINEGIEIIETNQECAIFVIETEYLDPLDVFLRGIVLLMEKSKNLKDEINKSADE